MRAYSLDLRQRVVRAYEQGQDSIAQLAARFGVGPTFVKKMLRQHRETGDLAPRPRGGGRRPSLSPKLRQLLRRKVERGQDIRRLRFIDEPGVNLAMTRLHGRTPRGERVRGSVPRNYGAHTSVIGTPGLSGPGAVWTVEGAEDDGQPELVRVGRADSMNV